MPQKKVGHFFYNKSLLIIMNGELDYDDILHFPEEIVVEKINDFYLVIAVQTANWIVLYNSRQIDFLNMLRSGKCVGDVIETVDSEEAMGDLKIVLAAIFARKFAGVNGEVTKEYLEGYKMLNIYITNACNLKCKHCFMLSGKKLENELTLEDWMKVLTSFKENGGEFVTFSGGEPLMFKNFPQIISHAHDLGLKSTVLSNGLLWSGKLIHDLALFIDEIQFSLDGVDEETNSMVRGSGHFEKVVDTIVKFANAGVKTSVATTFTYDNLNENTQTRYKNLVDLIKEKTSGKDVFFKLSKKLLPGRDVHFKAEENEKYSAIIKDIEKHVDENADYENFLAGHTANLVAINCGLGGISVSSDGNVYFCNRINEMESFGNVTEKPMSFFMEKGKEIHLATSVENVIPCKDCELRYICDGGCRIDDFDFAGKIQSSALPYHQISCNDEKKNKLKKRMIDSFNYFYKFD
ncbi:radical SAM protein [Phocaeicola dorei]|jgi:radical SAM protein with 4Fe4S-binding SPASM domain|uniref:Radical SAM protein n=3 Tax=Phocaeicola TaxID=909656 RepID=A0A7J5MBC4_PHOVU|nr:radical SAM protein [Phocaeicola vulgatus]PQL55596.1 radical SAM protein [Phocaeicola vulgatus]TWV70633.1 radical SAM protein [Phocaeicola dorei]TWV88750.1 radical SAM protein [Phocaeicola dorei]